MKRLINARNFSSPIIRLLILCNSGRQHNNQPDKQPHIVVPRENLYIQYIYQERYNKIHQILDQLNLRHCTETLLTQLSIGQQRRLSLAKLLLIKADCWILDEPFTSLDKQGITLLSSLMEKQSARGGVIVFTSHSSVYSLHSEIKKIFL